MPNPVETEKKNRKKYVRYRHWQKKTGAIAPVLTNRVSLFRACDYYVDILDVENLNVWIVK
jgi:hypothetical protein